MAECVYYDGWMGDFSDFLNPYIANHDYSRFNSDLLADQNHCYYEWIGTKSIN